MTLRYGATRGAFFGLAAVLCISFGLAEQAEAKKPRGGTFKVYRKNLGRGSSPSGSAYKYIQKIGCLDAKGRPSDDAGHIVAKSLGGRGGPRNIFPQNPTMNRGKYRSFEQDIAKLVAEKKGRKFVYAEPVLLKISFSFGNRKFPDRPTGVRYCYEARKTGGRTEKKCKFFGNRQPSQCFAASELGASHGHSNSSRVDKAFDRLMSRAKAFLARSKRLRNISKSMPKRYINAVCTLDAEKRNGPAWRAESRMYAQLIVRRVKHNYDMLLREHRALMDGFKHFRRKRTKRDVARRWHRKLATNFRTIRNIIDGNLFAGLKPERQAALTYNTKQHERMQRKWRCEQSTDGTERKPDCIDYDSCQVLEFAPSSSRDKRSKQAQAMGAANRLNRRWKRNPPSKVRQCFSRTGPTRGKGMVGTVKVYRACH